MNNEEKKEMKLFRDHIGGICASTMVLLFMCLSEDSKTTSVLFSILFAQIFGEFLAVFIKDRKKIGYLLISLLPLALSIYFTVIFVL